MTKLEGSKIDEQKIEWIWMKGISFKIDHFILSLILVKLELLSDVNVQYIYR